eukprot:GFUD01081148.1.p2 GENE.GFUD01081148.1~~GFUD01081148.1.p2  ORF type:complete len:122 (+),score=0.37 GFUD01081148.1:504-869(+)
MVKSQDILFLTQIYKIRSNNSISLMCPILFILFAVFLFLLLLLLSCPLLQVLPGQLPLGVDQVQHHHEYQHEDEGSLGLSRHIQRHPSVDRSPHYLDLVPHGVQHSQVCIVSCRSESSNIS